MSRHDTHTPSRHELALEYARTGWADFSIDFERALQDRTLAGVLHTLCRIHRRHTLQATARRGAGTYFQRTAQE